MSSDSLLGKMVDDYRLDKPLGAGGMARVYRAIDTKLRRYVALKIIASKFQLNSDYRVRFEREAQSIARLEHPNIVQIYRFGQVDGLYYMAMQYIEGSDVEHLIDDYKRDDEVMPLKDVTRILRDVGAALDYAHSKGVIHRDIKPGNIMINNQGQAILTDFGLALLSDVGTRGEIFGSPHYIAPEQAISSAHVVPQSDLYGLGVTLFEMLTGELPFNSDDPMELAMRHMTEPPPPPSFLNKALPPAIDEVVLRSLQKDPQQRFQSGAEFSAAFQVAVASWEGQPVSVVAQGRRPSLVKLPEKVQAAVVAAPLPPLPPLPPGKSSKPITQPAVTAPATTIAHRPVPASPAEGIPTFTRVAAPQWYAPLIFGAAVFGVGLIALVLFLLVESSHIPATSSDASTMTSRPVSSTSSPTDLPTATLTPTAMPTATALILVTTTTSPITLPTDMPTPTALILVTTAAPITLPTDVPTPTALVLVTMVAPTTELSGLPTSTPIPPTPLATTSATTMNILYNKSWVAFANISQQPISLDGFQLQRDGKTLKANNWGRSQLLPGECLRIYNGDKAPKQLPPTCTRAIDYAASQDERQFWLSGQVTVFLNPTTSASYPPNTNNDDSKDHSDNGDHQGG